MGQAESNDSEQSVLVSLITAYLMNALSAETVVSALA